MASAEILRIIAVGSKDESPGQLLPGGDTAPYQSRRQATSRLALWPAPQTSTAIVADSEPVPLIRVERVAAPESLDPRLVLLRAPTSLAARGYRLLRHRLLGEGDPRVVAVTSARAGEGKTTCAVNLALALAEDARSQVLLVEANLGRPVLARLFGFDPYDSLIGRMIRTRSALPPYPITAIAGTRLHLAALAPEPVGDTRLDRSLLLALLSDLREVYDYVVIDAGPVLESADADVIGECSSGVVVTATTGKSRRQDMRTALDQLRPTPVFGTVLFEV